MPRVQLALNVADLDAAVAFYSVLFSTEPAKVRPGYANFAVDDPPLELVLIEGGGPGGTLNHLGVEVVAGDEVAAAGARLAAAGLVREVEENVTCCYAVQDKVWLDDPDGVAWEVYTVLSDAETSSGTGTAPGESACCAGAAGNGEAAPGASACCAGAA